MRMHGGVRPRRAGGRITAKPLLWLITLSVGIALAAQPAWPQDAPKAVTDSVSYNAGSEVRLKVFLAPSEHTFDIFANLRYAGEKESLEQQNVEIASHLNPAQKETATDYHALWKIPEEARTGRYEVDVTLSDSQSHQVLSLARRVASFSVYRKLVKIERIQLDRTFYTPGDPVACKVELRNLTGHTIGNLRVEFSDRYWPWTAQTSERAGVDVVAIGEGVSLPAGGEHLSSPPGLRWPNRFSNLPSSSMPWWCGTRSARTSTTSHSALRSSSTLQGLPSQDPIRCNMSFPPWMLSTLAVIGTSIPRARFLRYSVFRRAYHVSLGKRGHAAVLGAQSDPATLARGRHSRPLAGPAGQGTHRPAISRRREP